MNVLILANFRVCNKVVSQFVTIEYIDYTCKVCNKDVCQFIMIAYT